MSRGFWGGVMLFSLAVTGSAGFFVYTNLEKHATVEVPLTSVRTVPVRQSVPAGAAAASPVSTPVPTAETNASAPGDAASSEGARRILFSFRSSTARKVYVVGDFNKWFRQPMVKKDKVWSATLEIKPGTYEYKFVVDNKRIKDPNNKNASPAGNSLIVVKPAAS
jgi:hypothetical protein